jgi:HAE1 family hydrophobic/amphiphilic exporter-1
LAIGIVVDDAIVVVEAVQHHIDADKMTPLQATYQAMSEVQAPVIAIALVLAAVFVPVAFIPGVSGRLYQQFALTIAFSVLLSAFLALTFTPALCTMLLRPAHVTEKSKGLLNRFFYRFNRWFTRTTDRYTRGVRLAIRRTPFVLAGLVVLCLIAFFLFRIVPTTFIPQEDMGTLIISVELPDAASSARTRAIGREINDILLKDKAIAHFMGVSGINIVANAIKPNSATYFLSLKPWDERYKGEKDDMNAVIGRLQGRLAQIPGAQILAIPFPTLRGFGTSGGFSFILEQKTGTDLREFSQVMGQFLAAVNKRPEIMRAYTFFSSATPEYDVEVDRDKCKQMGVAISDVFNTLQTYLGGLYVNDFTRFSRAFRVVLQADTMYRQSIDNLGMYYVRNASGQMVPLSALTTHTKEAGAPVLNHFNLYRSVEIDGVNNFGYSSGDALKALQEVAAEVLPANFGYEWANISKQEIEAGNKSTMIFMLSILFVFLLLVALYESWSVPLAVLLAVPIALFGSIVALYLAGQQNSVYSQVGLITLIGLAAKTPS